MAQAETSSPTSVTEISEHEPAIESSKARRLYFILGAVVLLLLIGYGVFALMTSGKETTDDAQVAADVVPVAARISGQVVEVPVHENQFVHRGDVIALIDPGDAQVRVQQATGDLETARAQAAAADARASPRSCSAKARPPTSSSASFGTSSDAGRRRSRRG